MRRRGRNRGCGVGGGWHWPAIRRDYRLKRKAAASRTVRKLLVAGPRIAASFQPKCFPAQQIEDGLGLGSGNEGLGLGSGNDGLGLGSDSGSSDLGIRWLIIVFLPWVPETGAGF